MVVTRSQGDLMEAEERRVPERRGAAESRNIAQREQEDTEGIHRERSRRLSLAPPASPSVRPDTYTADAAAGAIPGPSTLPTYESRRSPVPSIRSTTSVTARLRLAELEAAEKLAALKRREYEMEADLIKKRLATEVSLIQEEESVHNEPLPRVEDRSRVESWLRNNPPNEGREPDEPRTIHLSSRPREQTPTRPKVSGAIEQLAETLERMARPRIRQTELPIFAGNLNDWLPFKAAMTESTRIYSVTPAENLLRLRNCLRGEARDAVAALLFTATDPKVIMNTLEQCYGRPEVIIDRTLDELRKLPRPGPAASDLNNFAIRVQNATYVLQNIDKKGYLHNPMLTREVLEKLSPHVRTRWCDYATDYEGTTEPEIVMLSRFLMQEADRALRHNYVPSLPSGTSVAKKERNTPPVQRPRRVPVYNTSEDIITCPKCSKNHRLAQCPDFRNLSTNQRWEFVKENKLCFKCIASKHRRINCRAKPCGVNQCRRPHHASLHTEPRSESTEPIASGSQEQAVLSVNTTQADSKNVLLKVCPITIIGARGQENTYALLDEGSTVTLIDEGLAQRIGADGPTRPLTMRGVNMNQTEKESRLVDVRVRGRKERETLNLRAHTVKELKLHKQTICNSYLNYEHLRNLDRNEVCYEDVRPGILIGTDHWELIVSRELRTGGRRQPAASRTHLGWVVHGTVPRGPIGTRPRGPIGERNVYHIMCEPEREELMRLHNCVDSHFQIDALGVAHAEKVSDTDRRAVEIAETTIRKIEKGYEIGLPWVRDNVRLPQSYDAALHRLRAVERKMDSDPRYKAQYTTQIENMFQKGYATPCDGTESSSAVSWFLPHFGVTNVNKPGKLRLVFDAAARSKGVSLNDNLLEGPNRLLSLLGILFRFRERPVAVTADIREMFLQVKIPTADQPAQQFLWRGDDRTSPPARYKMTSMIFGAVSSPFMAHFVRDYNARAHAETHPRALEAITRCHYMDDLVASYGDVYEAAATIRETMQVHEVAGFELRGWSASDVRALREVPAELRAESPKELTGAGYESKILGLIWNSTQDELGFNTSMNRVPTPVKQQLRTPTKREALSAVMSIYDPLGLISQFTIRAKIILQSLWRLQISWDQPIPDEEGEAFARWIERLPELGKIRLRRCYEPEAHTAVELHIFCDASEQAYATVAYWRAEREDGTVGVSLVGAKAKVTPRRTQTVPRLELQAAVIGARLARTIKTEHNRIDVARVIYWTDSTTVLHWIRRSAKRYTPFVAHRLGEIAELTQPSDWRWLPTKDNVADDATRLINKPIKICDRWFTGPAFLYEPEAQWPVEDNTDDDDTAPEVYHVIKDTKESRGWTPDASRFSRYENLVRTVARVLYFIDRLRRRATCLELKHIEQAERALIQQAQADSFTDEIQKLKNEQNIPRSSRLWKLDPVWRDDLLRVRGRIGAADASQETKQPIILDGRHRLTQLIVLQAHSAAGHANRERVTNDLRQRYYVINLRPTVRAVERSCALCRVRRSRPQAPTTGDLPRARLEPFTRPFSNCGVDYFGPMVVKVGRRHEKRWGALFTCLTTRAVHIELVHTLSTDSALMAMRRMAARRGWPRLMYSDNATNFRGADQELKNAYAEWGPALQEEALKRRMNWIFIPPGAPNQGGAWERLVRSVKTALHATLRERTPPEEVLKTLLAEAEYSVNARPLTHVSVDPADPEALTPNHFLLGSSNGLPTTGSCDETDRRAWRASQALADLFWRRWIREYLPTLVPRGEPMNLRRPLQPGDVVLVVDATLPRNMWPIGVIEHTYPGPDGGVRVVDVRTRTGTFKRPATRIVVLTTTEATQAAPGGELLRTNYDGGRN